MDALEEDDFPEKGGELCFGGQRLKEGRTDLIGSVSLEIGCFEG